MAAEDMKEAAAGVARENGANDRMRGFQTPEIIAFLTRNAMQLRSAELLCENKAIAAALASGATATLQKLIDELGAAPGSPRLEDLERRLTVVEDKLFAVLLSATPDNEIVSVRAQADRELAPYRSKMPAAQIQQLQKQYLNKKLLEKYKLPRLSLFYM
jgi:hypothetical protein